MTARTVAEKLLIKPNSTVWVSQDSYAALVEPLPDRARRVDRPEEAATALVFAENAAALRDILTTRQDQLIQPSTLWIVYPKAEPD